MSWSLSAQSAAPAEFLLLLGEGRLPPCFSKMQVKGSGRAVGARTASGFCSEQRKRKEAPCRADLPGGGGFFEEKGRLSSPSLGGDPGLISLQTGAAGAAAAAPSLRRKRQRLASSSLKRGWFEGGGVGSRQSKEAAAAFLAVGASRGLLCPAKSGMGISPVSAEQTPAAAEEGALLPRLLEVAPPCGWAFQVFDRRSSPRQDVHSGQSALAQGGSAETRGVLTAQQQLHKEKMELLLKEQLLAYRRDFSSYAGWRCDGSLCAEDAQL